MKATIDPLFFQRYKAYLAQPQNTEKKYKEKEAEITSLLNRINELQQTDVCTAVGTAVNALTILVLVENTSVARTRIRAIFKESPMKIERIDSVSVCGKDYSPYLLNAAAKIMFLKDLPAQAVFARGYGIGFFQEELSMSFNVYFKADQYPFVKIMAKAQNMEPSQDPQPYQFAVDSLTNMLYVFGSSEIRYVKREGRIGAKKATQHMFASAPDAQEEWLKSNAGSACINKVISALRKSNMIRLEPESVECIAPNFSIATKQSKKDTRQYEQAFLETELDKSRFQNTDITLTRKTPQMRNLVPMAEIYARACHCTPYIIPIPNEWDSNNGFCFQIFANTPIAVDFVSRSFRKIGTVISENNQIWENHKNKAQNKNGSFYFGAKKVEVYFLEPIDEVDLTIKQLDEESKEIYEEESLHLSRKEIEQAIIEQHESAFDTKHHIVIQTNDSDSMYLPDFSKQYVTVPELTNIQSINNGITLFKTIRKELLLVKADISEQRAESFPAGYGWSCIWHQTRSKEQKKGEPYQGREVINNLKMSLSLTGEITFEGLSKSYLHPNFEQEEAINEDHDYWCLQAPDGRRYLVQQSDLRQILYDDGNGPYSRSQKAKGTLIENIRANTGYQHFRYKDGDYYLVGWDNSNNWQRKYHYIPHIYQIFSETGSLSEEEWNRFFCLCDVGFVRAASDSTVLPAFAKYLREYDRVISWRKSATIQK